MKKNIDSLRPGFTLIELIIVMVLIVILASVALPSYLKSQGDTKNKEAIATLKLLRSAQRAYRLDTGGYYGSSDHASINTALKVQLPLDAANRNWNYTMRVADGCCQADSTRGAVHYRIRISEEEPVSSTCP